MKTKPPRASVVSALQTVSTPKDTCTGNKGRVSRVPAKRVAFAEVSVIFIRDPCDSRGRLEVPRDRELLTPKEKRRRKAVLAVVCTTSILLTASALFVLITLFHASAIDEAVRRENESSLQTLTTSSGDILNSTATDFQTEMAPNSQNFSIPLFT